MANCCRADVHESDGEDDRCDRDDCRRNTQEERSPIRARGLLLRRRKHLSLLRNFTKQPGRLNRRVLQVIESRGHRLVLLAKFVLIGRCQEACGGRDKGGTVPHYRSPRDWRHGAASIPHPAQRRSFEPLDPSLVDTRKAISRDPRSTRERRIHRVEAGRARVGETAGIRRRCHIHPRAGNCRQRRHLHRRQRRTPSTPSIPGRRPHRHGAAQRARACRCRNLEISPGLVELYRDSSRTLTRMAPTSPMSGTSPAAVIPNASGRQCDPGGLRCARRPAPMRGRGFRGARRTEGRAAGRHHHGWSLAVEFRQRPGYRRHARRSRWRSRGDRRRDAAGLRVP